MVNVSRLRPLAISFTVLLLAISGPQRTAASSSAEAPGAAQPSENVSGPAGIPITSELVWEACGSCHLLDDQDRMSRISYMRATPEGWEHIIRRMVGLSGLQIEPEQAREVVKYLSNHLGLAPEEFRPVAFEAERRMIDYTYSDRDTEKLCVQCHSMGRVLSQRRTREEWGLMVAMHRGLYPLIDIMGFRRMGPSEADSGSGGGPRDNRQPMDKAIDHLAKAFPLQTREWTAWSANLREPKLEGTWALVGHQLGKGPVYGRVVITPTPNAPDEFVTRTSYLYPQSGRSATRRGNAIVYTGFQWRGRSVGGDQETERLHEVMLVERDWQQMGGRWFTGAYDETGLDITLRRAGSGPMAVGVHPRAVRSSTRGQEMRIYGVNLPTTLEPADLDFGQGVTVTRVVGVTSDVATVELDVAADAVIGARDVFVAQALTEHGFVVYDRIDAIKVTPEWGMARVGGVAMPKQYQQFEAVAYHNGPDGTPDTEDDLRLGMIDADWRLEEFPATFDDDDVQFVGAIDADGLFTPAVEGPNPRRRNPATSNLRNNIGDVWVVATFTPEGDQQARVLRARAHLVVVPPMYRRWYPAEAGQ